MRSKRVIGTDENGPGAVSERRQQQSAEPNTSGGKMFTRRERHTRREHDERERERLERSAPDRGGGRTGNMAAGAPVPGVEKSISPSRGRLKRKNVRFRFTGVDTVRKNPFLRPRLRFSGPFSVRFRSTCNGFEINPVPCTAVTGTAPVTNPLLAVVHVARVRRVAFSKRVHPTAYARSHVARCFPPVQSQFRSPQQRCALRIVQV